MNIEINENIASGLLKYCDKNNIDFKKVVEESIIQNQLRHNINHEGIIYKNINAQELDKDDLKHFLKDVFHKNDENIKEALFGEIYENNVIDNYKYIFIEYKNDCKIVVITNDEYTLNLIKNNKALKDVRIEEHQAYSWITTYQTKVLFEKIENSYIILIC